MVGSVVFLAVAIYTTVTNVLYLMSYAESYGTSLASMWQDAVSYVISGFIPYFAYSFIVFVLGKFAKEIFESKCESKCECEIESEIDL